MALPKVKYPEFCTKVPSTGQEIKYRPYTVKEEKILLTAIEGGSYKEMSNAIVSVVDSCITTPDVDVSKFYLIDVEYLFMQIRIKSVGEFIEYQYTPTKCQGECSGKTYNMRLDLNTVTPKRFVEGKEETDLGFDKFKGNGLPIKLCDEYGITVTYPKVSALNNITENMDDIEYLNQIMYETLISVYTEEDVTPKADISKEEYIEWVDGLMSDQSSKIEKFYDEVPVLRHTQEFTCKHCGNNEPIVFEGLYSFFT
jgi:hypothetical protein